MVFNWFHPSLSPCCTCKECVRTANSHSTGSTHRSRLRLGDQVSSQHDRLDGALLNSRRLLETVAENTTQEFLGQLHGVKRFRRLIPVRLKVGVGQAAVRGSSASLASILSWRLLTKRKQQEQGESQHVWLVTEMQPITPGPRRLEDGTSRTPRAVSASTRSQLLQQIMGGSFAWKRDALFGGVPRLFFFTHGLRMRCVFRLHGHPSLLLSTQTSEGAHSRPFQEHACQPLC